MSKSATRLTRRTKTVAADPLHERNTKEKFMQSAQECEAPIANVRFDAKTINQKLALSMLREGKQIVFLTGSAGTGKSLVACYHAATLLKAKKIEKIFLVRPAVAVGKSIGMLPGDISEKMTPFFAQTLVHLSKFLGNGYLKYCLEKEIIEMKPAEYLRGMSLENCVCIVEESQNFSKDEFEMVLTRLGEGATLIFTGDQKQHDLRGLSGLEETLNLIEKTLEEEPDSLLDEDLDALSNNVGVVRFTPDDVVRSGLTRSLVKMYYFQK